MLRLVTVIAVCIVVTTMSITACESELPPVPKEQLFKDLEHATNTAEALSQAIGPDLPWKNRNSHQGGCFATDGTVIGYNTSHSLFVKSDDVGHDLDDKGAFDIARAWLIEMGYEFRRDTRHDSGLREIWAVRETETIGIGIVVDAHPGGFRVKATSKCRS